MKLRIPLALLTFGLISGIYQQLPEIYINFFFSGIQFLLTVGLIIFALEKYGINNKKVHPLLGIVIASFGILIDSFL